MPQRIYQPAPHPITILMQDLMTNFSRSDYENQIKDILYETIKL